MNGAGPAKVVRVYSSAANGTYGVGAVIPISVQFTSAVDVVGQPTLALRSGCHTTSCNVYEVQRVRCMATAGKFAIAFGDQRVVNIPYDASPKHLADFLTRMTHIDQVKVEYNIDNAACTFFGNNITITFLSMNIDGIEGDLPQLTTDMTNANGDGNVLQHIHYTPSLTSVAWEILKGQRAPDRLAPFTSQPLPDTLQFSYTVQPGDNASALEYAGSAALERSLATGRVAIYNGGTLVNADPNLPPPGSADDWERGFGSSLSWNSALCINVSAPTVVNVSSSHVDGTFGIGESIPIQVSFSQPIVVTGTPTIVLETGQVDRIVMFAQVLQPAGTIAEFIYVVQAGDTSPDLSYTSTTALQLNGGSIKRASTTSTTDADLSLPGTAATGSLSVNKNLVIDTTKPKVIGLSAITPDNTYTAGDTIAIQVQFDNPVIVTGVPQLLLSTTSVDLFPGSGVQAAPTAQSTKTILFPNVEHGLSTSSGQGLQFSIGGQILTVNSVSGDYVTMVENYTGTVVDPTIIGSAIVPIKSPGYRAAKYISGSNTTALRFEYQVQNGDYSTDLDCVSTAALILNGGTIKRSSTTPFTDADLTLPTPGATASLGNTAAIVINTDAPRILQTNFITRDGVYRSGDSIYLAVIFDIPVVVFNTASILMTASQAERSALYDGGSGSTTLLFRFDCQPLDQASVFDVVDTNALRASYGEIFGWIRRLAVNPTVSAILTLPVAGMTSKDVSIDSSRGYVALVQSTHVDGIFGAGEVIDVAVTYSVAVFVDVTNGIPTLALTTGRPATYTSGSGMTTLTFRYVVLVDDVTTQLDCVNIFALVLNGASITDAGTGLLVSTLLPKQTASSLILQNAITINTSPLSVVDVTTRALGDTYTVGDTLVISVQMDRPVYVPAVAIGAGTPALLLNVGVHDGVRVPFLVNSADRLYFSYTVTVGHSTALLSYVDRTSLICVEGDGMNKDGTMDAQFAHGVLIPGTPNRVFITWAETTAAGNAQIRVKTYATDRFPPLWSYQEGAGINWNAAMHATGPMLVRLGTGLYLVWQEISSTANNPSQIRVASYNGVLTAPQWIYVEKLAPNNVGLNRDTTQSAAAPHAAIHSSKLYVAWHEVIATASAPQIRVAVYNSQDVAPAWTFVDGNQANRGINYGATSPAQNVRLVSCASLNNATTILYAAWEEQEPTTRAQQIRVAVQTRPDSAPKWTHLTGKAAFGINVDTTMDGRAPSLSCYGSNIVVAWHEGTAVSLNTRIRVKQFNGNVTNPSWVSLDNSKGINSGLTQNAANVRLRVCNSKLYAAWQEMDSVSLATHARVAMLSSLTNGVASWSFLDRRDHASSLNRDSERNAAFPVLVMERTYTSMVAVWQEQNANGKYHIRASTWSVVTSQWQYLLDSCVRTLSTTPTTAANLLLPEVSTIGSLDFNHAIRIDTSSPVVRSVRLRGEVPPMLSAANPVQTIDIFNLASLTQGEYRLTYGDEHVTSCIAWNAPASGVKNALESIPSLALSVLVSQDATAFQDGQRNSITFVFPSMGQKELRVQEDTDGTCQSFVCSATPRLPCGLNLIRVNGNTDVNLHSGVLDASVDFSFPVVVSTGSPTLTLDTGAVDQVAVYTSRSSFQEFDVGTNSPSFILQGAFRLAYGDFSTGVGVGTILRTDCIEISLFDSDAIEALTTQLQSISPLNTIGIRSVTRRRFQSGYRYGITFRNSADLLDIVPTDASACHRYTGRTQTIDISAASSILQGQYKIQYGASTSACIPWDLSATDFQEVLSGIVLDRVVPLQVVTDPSLFTLGHRYYLTFMRLDDAQQPLIISADPNCLAFSCDDGAGGSIPCSNLVLSVNSDFIVTRAASETISFQYKIQSQDESLALTCAGASSLFGNILRSSKTPTLSASLGLLWPATPLKGSLNGSFVSIASARDTPVVTQVYSTTLADTYTAGDVIVLLIDFSIAVVVNGQALVLELNSGGTAAYFAGSGSTLLEFRYKIESGESSSALDYQSTVSLRTVDDATQILSASNAEVEASLVLPAPGASGSIASRKAFIVDTSAPVIRSVYASHARTDTYGLGDVVDIIVEFSQDVSVVGTPSLLLNTGGIARFSFGGYRQVIDVGVNAIVPVTSGQFAVKYKDLVSGCIDFNDAQSAATTSFKSRLLEFAELELIGVNSVTLTAKKNGHRFVVVFQSTNVLDLPAALSISPLDICAPLFPPSSDLIRALVTRDTDQFVTFQYAVAAGETTLLLDYTATSVALTVNTDSILRNARVPTILANVALPDNTVPAKRLSGGSVVKVDGTPISIVGVVSDTADGTYGVGYPAMASPATVFPGEVLFRLIFSRPVRFVGSPAIELATGSLQANGLVLPNRFAKYVNQPSPTEAAFLYHIQEGDYSLNLAFSSTSVLQNAQIYAVAAVPSLVTSLQAPRLVVSSTGTIKIDSLSVPTTVNISSPHSSGTFGAGEVIELDVTLSKQVILQSGLNRYQQWYARNPVALEFQSNIYVMWTEWEKPIKPTKSYLYLNVYASDTLQLITTASPGALNKVPNSFIERASMAIWNNNLYAAWDEGGLLSCAVYNGLSASNAWTLIPNMGANKNMQMAASNAILVVHNLMLLVIWREMALPINSATMVGQIRVAQRNDDYDAPLWIFHDGNSDTAGLNRNPLMDAMRPSVAVYRSVMYVAWAEATADGVYEIVVAKRYLQTRDVSTWGYLTPQASTKAAYNFISAYRPQMAVRKRGIEDVALQIMWYRDTVNDNVSEIVAGQILPDGSWEGSIISPPLVVASNVSVDQLDAERPELATCGSSVFASWIEMDLTSHNHVLKLAELETTLDLYSGWKTVFEGNANQNPRADVDSMNFICTSTTTSSPQLGIFWTEFDGIMTKLRFRHVALPQPTRNLTSWGEISTGTPLIKMATGTIPSGYAQCVDLSGIQTYTLHFAFIVQPGYTSLALEVFDTGAILMNGALIQDLQGQSPDWRLFPGLQDPRSLSFTSDLVLDTSDSTVRKVTSTTVSGEYGVGERILIQVVFSSPVILTPAANTSVLLYLRSDELHYYAVGPRAATYLSGSRSNTLTFEYTTVSLDFCTALDYAAVDSLTLQGGATIKRDSTFPTTNAQLTLPVPRSSQSLSGQRQIAIRATAPQVLSVTSSTPDGTYYPGDTIMIQVTFSLAVTVFGAPFLNIDTSQSEPAQATYASGNETTTLSFAYTVQAGDFSSDLELTDDRQNNLGITYVHSLVLPLGAQIKRKATNPTTFASIILPSKGATGSLSLHKNLVVDSTVPTIVDIRSPTADGTYKIGQEITILVEFSRNVVVRDTPLLLLNILAETDCVATYVSGSTTTVLTFSYTPVEGDNTGNTALDYRSSSSFMLLPLLASTLLFSSPSQVLLLSSNPIVGANVTLPRPGTPLTVDAVRSLVGNNQKIYVRTDGFQVQDLAADVPSGETYAPGQRIVISVTFTDIVVVQGAPRLLLNVNVLIARYATYLDGSGSPTLRFVYIVSLGDSCTVLEADSRSALDLNGGVITDADGMYVPLQLGAPGFAGSLSYRYQIGVSSISAAVTRVYSQNPIGIYGVGDIISVIVEFDRNVTISPTAPVPTLLIQLDGHTRSCSYSSGGTSRTLVFTLSVIAGDATQDLEYANQIALAGTILTQSTTSTLQANLQLPTPGAAQSLSSTSAVRVVTTAPTVLNVKAVAQNGTYGLNDRLRFRVRYSFRVVMVSVPVTDCQLELSAGPKRIATASYCGGSGTDTLEFGYRVEAGDMASRLDYVESQSLACSILQYSANPTLAASTSLPKPGQAGSLGISSSLRIDSTAVRVASVSSLLANGVYGAGQDIDITVTFSGAVTLVGGVPRLQLALASNAQLTATPLRGAVYATYFAGSGTETLTFCYRTVEGDMALPLTYQGIDALSMASPGAQILDANGNRHVALRLPSPLATGSLANNRDIRIDTLDSLRVIAVGSPTADGSYTVGDIVLISVTFSAPVVVVGAPTLQLETGNPDGFGSAQYVSGTGSTKIMFGYAVRLGDNTDRLEYTRCPDSARRVIRRREWSKLVICSANSNALQLPVGASIKRLATLPTTDAILDLPEVNAWPKIRFDSARNGYIYVDQVELTTDASTNDRAELAAAVLPVNEISMSEQTNSIYVYSSGIPDHASSIWSLGQLQQQAYFMALARFPKQKSNPLNTTVAVSGTSSALLLGIFLNGVPFTNLQLLGNLSALSIDACGGTVDPQNRYVYVTRPTCYLESVQETADPMAAFPQTPSPVVGYAFDGFPIYGYYDENGQLPALDECNGRLAASGQYVYHLVPSWTSSSSTAFMPCLKGVDSTTGSTLLKVFRSPADIGEIQGLSLPLLSQFDGFVIDETQEALQKASLWLNPSGVSVVYTASSVIVRSNGIPNGNYGPFPNVYNPHRITEQNYVFVLPRQPTLASTTTTLPLDVPIGVMLNGIPFFASSSALYGNVMSSSSKALHLLDKCNGLVDAGGDYRYYASPDCLLEQLGVSLTAVKQPSPLIGYALDGFPLYGPYTEAGVLPTDLDACNGRIGDDGVYRYHVTTTAPYLIGCFHGVLSSSTNSDDIYRSLSYAHALRLNTDPPQVAQIYSNKWPGTYVAGETLDLVIRWSAPVSVGTTAGTPCVMMAGLLHQACYDASRSSSLESVFMFLVTASDEAADWTYVPRSQLQMNGGSILRLSAVPTVNADPRLVLAEHLSLLASKHQIIQSVRVELRGLYHPSAADLRVNLYHGRRRALVFGSCCSSTDAFGSPDEKVHVNIEQINIYPSNPTSGVGFDYTFQDLSTSAKNLAIAGGAIALQSSTSGHCAASFAIDGVIGGRVSTQTVARTASESDTLAWWELRLLHAHSLGTIRIWLLDEDEEKRAGIVQIVRVNSMDGVQSVDGSFTLVFTSVNGSTQTTADISYNAVAMQVDEQVRVTAAGIGKGESMQSKLAALPNMPPVFVTRSPADAAMSDNGAFTWSITFLGDPRMVGLAPNSPLTLGTNAVCSGTGTVSIASPVPGDDHDDWVYEIRDDRAANVSIGKLSMVPFWVLLFDSTAMLNDESLPQALDAAIWYQRIDANRLSLTSERVVVLSPPLGLGPTQSIRIMAENAFAYLTIDEVEVFEERTYVLSQYPGGTPVATQWFPYGEFWSPEEPFDATFAGMSSEGVWTLSIRDTLPAQTISPLQTSHGAGAISDWVIYVTNMAGRITRYNMDVVAHVETLPRHGRLFVSTNETERDHLDFDGNGVLDSVEAAAYLERFVPRYERLPQELQSRVLINFLTSYESFGGIPVLTDPSERQKLFPILCDRGCLKSYGIDPYFYFGTIGDTGTKMLFLDGDRTVRYVPTPGFHGIDAFTFTITIGVQTSAVLGTVQLHVRDCRGTDCGPNSRYLRRWHH